MECLDDSAWFPNQALPWGSYFSEERSYRVARAHGSPYAGEPVPPAPVPSSPSIDPVPQDPRNVKNVNELPWRPQFPHELSKNALATSASTRVVKKCLGDLSSLLSCQKMLWRPQFSK